MRLHGGVDGNEEVTATLHRGVQGRSGQTGHRGFVVAEVAVRLGVSAHSLYSWIKRYSVPAPVRAQQDSQADEIRRLKTELRRVTEERDILKKAAAYVAKQSGWSTPS